MEESRKKSVVGDGAIFVPAVAMLFAAPFAMMEVRDLRLPFGPEPEYPFLPFWVGLLCVPGYVSAWRCVKKGLAARGSRRAWQMTSVAVAIICSFVGAIYAAFTILGGLLAAWSGIVALQLLHRLVARKPPQPDTATH